MSLIISLYFGEKSYVAYCPQVTNGSKRKRVPKANCVCEASALLWATDYFTKMLAAPVPKSFCEKLRDGLLSANLSKNLSKLTKGDINNLEKFAGSAVTFTDLAGYVAFLESKNYKAIYINQQISRLKRLCNLMIAPGTLTENPFATYKMQRAKKTVTHKPFDANIREKILANLDYETNMFCRLVFYCLLRPVEITRLTPRMFDFTHNVIILPATITKNGRADTVVIPDQFAPDLKRFVESRERLFPKSTETYRYNHKKALAALQLAEQGHTLYAWKHTGVCALYEHTKDPFSVMEHCRHSDLKMTQIYLRDLGMTRANNPVRGMRMN